MRTGPEELIWLAPNRRQHMPMHGSHVNGWVMLIGGIFWLLVIVVLVLGAAALLKYLRSGPR